MEERERGRGRDSMERSSDSRDPNRRNSGSSSGSGNGSRHGHRRSPPKRDNGDRPPEPPTPYGGNGSGNGGGGGGGRRTPPEPSSSHGGGSAGHGDKKRRLEESGNGNAAKRRPADEARSQRRNYDEIVHTRPHQHGKKGDKGREVDLMTNYFRVRHRIPNWSIHKYHVHFEPEVELIRMRKILVGQHVDLFGGYLFDGSQLFVTRALHGDSEELSLQSTNRENETYTLKLKFTKIVEMTESESLQVLNLIIKRGMEKLNLQPVGRNLYDPRAKIDMTAHRIQIWPGYATSIRQHEVDILLNAEILHKVMRMETVYDILKDTRREDPNNFMNNFKKKVLGATVLTDYNNKTYRIDDIDFDRTPINTIFERREGRISIMEYYEQRYHKTIRDPNQPLIISKPKARDIRGGRNEQILLVPELCRATGLTDAQKNNFTFKRDKDTLCQVDPKGRVKKLREFNQRLNRTQESIAVLTQWNLELERDLVRVKGRVLPLPAIVMGNETSVEPRGGDFYRSMTTNPVFLSVDIARWYFLVPKNCDREANQFLKTLQEVSRALNITVKDPRREIIQQDNAFEYTKVIDRCADNNPQIIVTLLRRNHADTYASIKKKCFIDRAVPSQVVVQRTISKPQTLRSVATKIAFQMLAKIEGAPWTIKIPVDGIMIIGFDITTDSRDKKISFGALVATMDLKSDPEFFSCVSQHTNGEEISTEFSQNVLRALMCWYQKYGSLPAQIIIYRDGVGDGQLMYVRDYEVNYLKEKLNEKYARAKAELKLIFIVVSKKIKTKFFKMTGGPETNPEPGTVVDDVVTLPERYDFFLVAQGGNQGTLTPTCFNVIHDTGSFPPGILQIITYRLCHMYYNWQGTVRVPAVCQYARKLSFMVANALHKVPSSAVLEKQLYYL